MFYEKKKKNFIFLFVLTTLILAMSLVGCGKKAQDSGTQADSGNQPANTTEDSSKNSTNKVVDNGGKNPIVTIEMEDGSKIKVELYPNIAPNTVRNFISLTKKGFYDGTIFHRIIPGFMIQGGDPKGTGSGGPGYSIKGEFTNNKFPNTLKHVRGVISMARSKQPNSAGSQFFIMVNDAPHLDGEYAAFGKVTEGMDTVDKIVNQPTDGKEKPVKAQKMKKVTVDTFGFDYGEVEK